MIEQKISKETLELARNKGFDLLVCNCGGYPDCICNGDSINQSLVQKWLREIYDIHIIINPIYILKDQVKPDYENVIISDLVKNEYNDRIYESTYEESLEIALYDALNLL